MVVAQLVCTARVEDSPQSELQNSILIQVRPSLCNLIQSDLQDSIFPYKVRPHCSLLIGCSLTQPEMFLINSDTRRGNAIINIRDSVENLVLLGLPTLERNICQTFSSCHGYYHPYRHSFYSRHID